MSQEEQIKMIKKLGLELMDYDTQKAMTQQADEMKFIADARKHKVVGK